MRAVVRETGVTARVEDTRAMARQTKVVVKRVQPWSVFKFSLLFYFCLMLVFLFALLILYWVMSIVGVMVRRGRRHPDHPGRPALRPGSVFVWTSACPLTVERGPGYAGVGSRLERLAVRGPVAQAVRAHP